MAAVCLMALSAWAEPTWVNQQGARLVIGQTSFTRQNPASSREVLGAAGGVAVAGNKLFVADGNRVGAVVGAEPNTTRVSNNRALIYNNLSSFVPAPDVIPPQNAVCPACVGVPDVVLGQPDFAKFNPALTQGGMNNPTHIASDGNVLAISDTDNNRVLIWRSIPTSNSQPPDVVVGQPDFTSNLPATTRQGLRGPQGLWIDNGKLYVADTVNGRVLVWNSIPAANGAAADLVLGEPDFETRPEPDLTQSNFEPSADRMLDPVSVTINNGRMYVSDLGFNRVLIFLSIPNANATPADVAIGQKDLTSGQSNAVSDLCELLPEGTGPGVGNFAETPTDTNGDGTIDTEDDLPRQYPRRCEKTLSFPRFALSDGQRLFVADSGNDRILVYNEIPLQSGVAADVQIGQKDFQSMAESDGAGSVRAPTALAHDGTNLYVADPFSRRILVFSPGEDLISLDGLRNGASYAILSNASVTFQNAPATGQEITITVSEVNQRFPEVEYKYTTVEGDTNLSVRDKVLNTINAKVEEGGPVYATPIEGEGVHAVGRVKFGGSSRPGDTVTLKIGDQTYTVQVVEGDPPERMVDRFKFVIEGARDPNVIADREIDTVDTLLLTARNVGPGPNSIPIEVTLSPGAALTVTADTNLKGGSFPYGLRLVAVEEGLAGNNLRLETAITGTAMTISSSGSRFSLGSEARELPPGTMAAMFGHDLSDGVYVPTGESPNLPTKLGGVEVLVNGIASPIYSVTPDQVNFQVPWQKEGSTVSVLLRRTSPDGQLVVSAARATPSTRAAPGIIAFPGIEPRRGIVLHGTGQAEGIVALSSPSATANDEGAFVINPPGVDVRVFVNGREYLYVTQQDDTLAKVRDALVALINNSNSGQGDPQVRATPGQQGFFSARADVVFGGTIRVGDTATITVRGRNYSYTVQEGDTLTSVRNILVQRINLGPNLDGTGDPEVTAQRDLSVGAIALNVIARDLGTSGNSIPFAVAVTPDSATITVTTNVENGVLEGGQTPPVVILTARAASSAANEITYSATSSDTGRLVATGRTTNLCCGNEPYSLVTEENPAIPGESIIIMATGLGLTNPQPSTEGLESGEPTPNSPLFRVPLNSDDFVSSLAGNKTATVEFVGLMPGTVGIYQVNLKLNSDLPDDRNTWLYIAQQFFVSNYVTFPVKNLTPRLTAAEETRPE